MAIVREAATPHRNAAPSFSLHGLYCSTQPLQSPKAFALPLTEVESLSSISPADKAHNRMGPSAAPAFPEDVYAQCRESSGLRQSMSNPSFAHQLSHKLSATFGNPTIVHRPNLRLRPSVLSIHNDSHTEKVLHEEANSLHDSTAPSSLNCNGSMSVGGISTGKTSLDSNFAALLSRLQHDVPNKSGEVLLTATAVDREKSLTPIQEAPLDTPTILTVETAANAKIFFETHYDPLLAGNTSSRSLRRRELEVLFDAEAVTEDRRRLERWAWANYESDHLRHKRVLKTKSKQAANNSCVAVAGYEVVRILGKGSFGVVRLVREREPNSLSTGTLASTTLRANQQTFGSELNNRESSTYGDLRLRPSGQKSQTLNKGSHEVYAMKVIRKSEMLRNCQEGHLRAERDFLVASEKSRWVVPLIASFQDRTNLYLVMEYMIGGDFLGLLFRRNILKERHARWYIAEMILCIEETHRHNWIHRDIKPDNFLISSSGHLKISDFGLAFDGHWSHDQRFYKNHRKMLMDKLGIEVKGDRDDQEEDARKAPRNNLASILTGRSRQSRENAQVDGPCEDESILQWRNREGKRRMAASVVGTSQYMAPEVIRGDPYDGRCDWWSIGIILYEVRTKPTTAIKSCELCFNMRPSACTVSLHSYARRGRIPKHAFW